MFAAFLSRTGLLSPASASASPRLQFEALVTEYAPALQRLTLGYEASADLRRDLQQEILVALWRALPSFEGRSSLKTWVFRIAHNVSASHSLRARRRPRTSPRSSDELVEMAAPTDGEAAAASHLDMEALARRVRALRPLDRQLILLFLEGFTPREIADVTGLSDTNVTTKLSRLRAVLRGQLEEGPRDD